MQSSPNPAVNTDAPRARLRLRRGSPVTLIRWASKQVYALGPIPPHSKCEIVIAFSGSIPTNALEA